MKKTNQRNEMQFKSGSIRALIVGSVAVTLYFNIHAYDPFNTPKLIILLALSAWLFGHTADYYRKNLISFKSSQFIYLIVPITFIVSQICALIFTDVFVTGIIGDTQRRNGILAYIALSIILIFCMQIVNYSFALRILKSFLLMGILLCVYGLMQTSGNDFVDWNNPNNSMIATLGNPNFASAILALITLAAFFSLFVKSMQVIYKVIALLLVLCSIVLISLSQSRQGFLVIFFALIFYLTVFIYYNKKSLRILLVSLTICSAGLVILGMLRTGPLATLIYKDSLSVRGYYWRAALEMFYANPIVGVGLDRYGAFFKQYREAGYAVNYGYEITSSNAHNVYLQLLSTGGVFVGISYLLLNILVFVVGIINIRTTSKEQQRINLLLLSCWIGFQSQSLISIDNIGISIWGWILGGCILGINVNSNQSHIENIRLSKKKFNEINVNVFQPVLSVLVLILVIFIAYNLNLIEKKTLIAKSYAKVDSQEARQIVFESARSVMNNSFTDPNYKFLVSLYMVDAGNLEVGHLNIVKLHEYDPRNLDYLNWLVQYERSFNNRVAEIVYREKITQLDPWNASNYLELGKLYKDIGDDVKSQYMFEHVLSFDSFSETASQARIELKTLVN